MNSSQEILLPFLRAFGHTSTRDVSCLSEQIVFSQNSQANIVSF